MTGPVVVVGAGASGLAVSALLGRRGVPYVLLEQAATVGSAWRNRYDSLRLHTARRFSGLPGAPLPRDLGPWVARDDLVSYLEDYARRFDVRPVHGVQVHRLERCRGGWALQTSAGPRDARAVVLATGFTRRPHLPAWPGLESYAGDLRHASAYRDPEPYRGRSVLVVGAGNSAAEIAVELTGVAARVELSVRTPPDIVRREVAGVPSQLLGIALGRLPAPVLGRLTAGLRRVSLPDLTPYGLPAPSPGKRHGPRQVPIMDHGFVAAVRRGAVTVVPAVVSFDHDTVHLADGTFRRPDAVVAATGYRPDLEPVVGHLGVLDADGLPRVRGATTLKQAPGLHFVGLGVELSGLLRRSGREARAVARALSGVPRPTRKSP